MKIIEKDWKFCFLGPLKTKMYPGNNRFWKSSCLHIWIVIEESFWSLMWWIIFYHEWPETISPKTNIFCSWQYLSLVWGRAVTIGLNKRRQGKYWRCPRKESWRLAVQDQKCKIKRKKNFKIYKKENVEIIGDTQEMKEDGPDNLWPLTVQDQKCQKMTN